MLLQIYFEIVVWTQTNDFFFCSASSLVCMPTKNSIVWTGLESVKPRPLHDRVFHQSNACKRASWRVPLLENSCSLRVLLSIIVGYFHACSAFALFLAYRIYGFQTLNHILILKILILSHLGK